MHEVAEAAPSPGEREGPLARKANETIVRVTDDVLRRFQFHTPIAALMELVNDLSGAVDAPDARFAAVVRRARPALTLRACGVRPRTPASRPGSGGWPP